MTPGYIKPKRNEQSTTNNYALISPNLDFFLHIYKRGQISKARVESKKNISETFFFLAEVNKEKPWLCEF